MEALGRKIIIEPINESSVLDTNETATVFKVVSEGRDAFCRDNGFKSVSLMPGDLIVVERGTVKTTNKDDKEVFYIWDNEAVARVNGQPSNL